MVIILAGGGSKMKAELIDKEFSKIISPNKPVLYLPFAREAPYESCLEWFKSSYEKYGITHIKMIGNPDEIDNLDFSSYSAVYVGGGNTFRLINSLNKTMFFKKLKQFLSSGGIYYGGSAGAIILGKTLSTASSENSLNSSNEGFDLLNGMSVACHYKQEEVDKLKKLYSDNQEVHLETSARDYSKIVSLLKHSALHNTMKKEGLNEVNKLTWDKPARRCLDIYKELIAKK